MPLSGYLLSLLYFFLAIDASIDLAASSANFQVFSFDKQIQSRALNTSLDFYEIDLDRLRQFNEGENPEVIHFEFPFANKKLKVKMDRVELLGPHFKVVNAKNQIQEIEIGSFYRYEALDTIINLSIFKDQVRGFFNFKGKQFSFAPQEGQSKRYAMTPEAILDSKLHAQLKCHTRDTISSDLRYRMQEAAAPRVALRNQLPPLDVYFELDHYVYTENGKSIERAVAFLTGIFNTVAEIYIREGIQVRIHSIKVWDSIDAFQDNNSTIALAAFKGYLNRQVPDQPWDMAVLVSRYNTTEHPAPNGGLAGQDALCNRTKRHSYANVLDYYETFPAYSWSAFLIAHEMGHTIANPHSHNCWWPEGPIDNCYCSEGPCENGPEPHPSGGTIMSYCYVKRAYDSKCDPLPSESNPGINFLMGFGPYPGNLMRNTIAEKLCITRKALDTLPNLVAGGSMQIERINQVFHFKGISIFNEGIAASGDFQLSLNDFDLAYGDTLNNPYILLPVKGLNPGDTFQLDTSFVLPEFIQTANLHWEIDARSEVEEWNEGDNFIAIDSFSERFLPDLEIKLSGNLVDATRYFILEQFSIQNSGAAAIGAGKIAFYLNTTTNLEGQSYFLGWSDFPGLLALKGQSQNVFFLKSKLKVPNGTYYLGYKLVPNDFIEEFSIGNNTGVFSIDRTIIINRSQLDTILKRH